jgi:hypothetical protein
MARYNAQVGETVYTFTSTNYGTTVQEFKITQVYKSSPSLKRNNRAIGTLRGVPVVISLVDCFSEAEALEKRRELGLS